MHNVTHELKGDTLIITVDVSAKAVKAAPPSSTGKTLLVATTGGALPVTSPHANLTMAINVMAKR
jgi:hypothetical protein